MRFPVGSLALGVVWMACGAVIATGKESMNSTDPRRPDSEDVTAMREFRGVWVATVANIDWPSKPGLTTAQQKDELVAIFDKVAALNMNAVIFQVRPHCDALYDSTLEPWSAYLTGQMGKAPDPYYDPLQVAVEEAHQRGLELHAWFNPYRALHPATKTMAPNHISKTHPEIVRKVGEFLWLDPAETLTQNHSLAVILDVVKRYDVDGIHLDDYFYPYPEYLKGAGFPDNEAWQKYQRSGGKRSRDDWRRENVNKFVERLYKEVKAAKPWVKVGISPFGIWRPGHPANVQGFDQYAKLYADARLWLNRGWLDYCTPQLYWSIDSPQPYRGLLKWWAGENPLRRNLWPGNGAHLIGSGEKRWPATEIVNQVKATRLQPGASGNVFFSMKVFLKDSGGIDEALTRLVYQKPALIPPSPWLDSSVPAAPTLTIHPSPDGRPGQVTWTGSGNVFRWALYSRKGTEWDVKVLPGRVTSYQLKAAAGESLPLEFALSALNRVWTEGPKARTRVQISSP